MDFIFDVQLSYLLKSFGDQNLKKEIEYYYAQSGISRIGNFINSKVASIFISFPSCQTHPYQNIIINLFPAQTTVHLSLSLSPSPPGQAMEIHCNRSEVMKFELLICYLQIRV